MSEGADGVIEGGFTKLDSGIVDSSIWQEPDDVLRMWVCLLAKANSTGYVRISRKALARLCNQSQERCNEIVTILESPDDDSRTPDNDGRRIARVDGGWLILNYERYRKRHRKQPMSGAERQRRYRERKALERSDEKCHVTKSDEIVTESDESDEMTPEAEAEAEADIEADTGSEPPLPPAGGNGKSDETVTVARGQETIPGVTGLEPEPKFAEFAEFAAEFVDCWNLVCEEQGGNWVKSRPFSSWGEGRKSTLRKRWKESGWRDGWEEALEKAKESPFWNGHTQPPPGRRKFKANVDTFLRRDTVMKLLEDYYSGDKGEGIYAGDGFDYEH